MPKEKQLHEVFCALVDKGLRFIEIAVTELDSEPDFSVAHFATGLELLLKSRLFVEHWTLIGLEPRTTNWEAVENGSARTIQASDLPAAIATVTGTHLQARAVDMFKAVFNHRNRVLHFGGYQGKGATSDIAAEQLRAWYDLHLLLTKEWESNYRKQLGKIDEINRKLLGNTKFLRVRFDGLENRLKGYKANGSLTSCESCGYVAGVLRRPKSLVSALECRVCLASYTAIRFGCGNWFDVSGLPSECSECEMEHSAGDLDEYAFDKELYCGSCFSSAQVVRWRMDGRDAYFCLECHEEYDEAARSECEWCDVQWIGYDTEQSYAFGCEECGGSADRHADD